MEEDVNAESKAPAAKKNNLKSMLGNKNIKMLLIVIVIAAISGGLYYAGLKHGKKVGIEESKTAAQQKSSSSNLLNLPVGGTVSKISDSEITVKLIGNETKTAKINSKTEVTNKVGKAKVSDIKKDSKVVVFTKADGKDSVATRILIQ